MHDVNLKYRLNCTRNYLISHFTSFCSNLMGKMPYSPSSVEFSTHPTPDCAKCPGHPLGSQYGSTRALLRCPKALSSFPCHSEDLACFLGDAQGKGTLCVRWDALSPQIHSLLLPVTSQACLTHVA
jgi:hypothetical protein